MPKFAEGWTFGREPDYILEMPVEFVDSGRRRARRADVLLDGAVVTEDRFAETLEIRPGNRAVVHHAGVFVVDIPEGATIVDGRLVTPDGKAATDRGEGLAGRADTTALPGANKLLSWVPGRGVDSHRADIGKRIPAGKYINWQMHYNPIGKPRDGSHAARHLVQQGAGDARTADPSGGRSAGDDQGRAVAVSRRGQGSRIHARTRAARGAAARRRTFRRTPRTGR